MRHILLEITDTIVNCDNRFLKILIYSLFIQTDSLFVKIGVTGILKTAEYKYNKVLVNIKSCNTT